MIALWATIALGAPSVALLGHQTMGPGASPSAGGTVVAAAPVGPVEVEAGFAADPLGYAAGFGGIRYAPAWAGGLSFAAGGGVASRSSIAPVGSLDLAFDVPLGPVDLRLDARSFHGRDVAALQIGAGLVARFGRRPEPAPVPEPEVAVVAPPVVAPAVVAPFSVEPPDALVWLPHPICQWVPATEAGAWAERLGGTLARVWAPGYLPADSDLTGAIGLAPAPPQGGLAVVAHPGDVVWIDGALVPVAEDGVAIVNAAEGVHDARIVGAGRDERLEGAVAEGYVTWLRASEPQPLVVRFEVGSAALPSDVAARFAALATASGDWTYAIAGSYSQEGRVDDNVALADARAAAVRDALIAAGMPADRLVLLPALPPDPGVAASEQRVARVTPRGPR